MLSSLSLPPSLLTSATTVSLQSDNLGARSNSQQQQQILQLQQQSVTSLKSLEQTLRCCNVIRVLLRPHIPLLVPTLCKVIEQLTDIASIIDGYRWLTIAVKTLRHVTTSARGNVIEQTNTSVTRIIHTLTSTIFSISSAINSNPQASNLSQCYTVVNECLDTVIVVGRQLGPRFITFDTLIKKAIDTVPSQNLGSSMHGHSSGINAASYLQLSSDIKNGRVAEFGYGDLSDYFGPTSMNGGNAPVNSDDITAGEYDYNGNLLRNRAVGQMFTGGGSKYVMNQAQLQKAWDVTQRTTASDWNEWLRRLRVDLIRESPIAVIRACAALSQAYPPLAHDLFHAAFVSCWQELSEPFQESLVRALQTVFRSNSIPPEILQTLLNLAEFMEHDCEALPISLSTLAELAQKSRAYAKALHYRELEFQMNPVTCFESLININKKLDQYDAAVGVVNVIKKMQQQQPELSKSLTIQDAWLAKLGYWDEALEEYNRSLELNNEDPVAIAGKLKCLDALGRWEEAIKICSDSLDKLKSSTASASTAPSSNIHTKAAVIGARAAWSLSEWDLMDTFVSSLSTDNVDGCFMRAVLATHRDDFATSEILIDQTRKQLDASISALLSESYGRAYNPLIMLQQCAELEEIMEYKKLLRHSSSIENSTNLSSSTPVATPQRPLRHVPRGRSRHATLSSLSQSVDAGNDLQSNSASNNAESGGILISPVQQQVQKHKIQLADKWRKRLRGCYSSGMYGTPNPMHCRYLLYILCICLVCAQN